MILKKTEYWHPAHTFIDLRFQCVCGKCELHTYILVLRQNVCVCEFVCVCVCVCVCVRERELYTYILLLRQNIDTLHTPVCQIWDGYD